MSDNVTQNVSGNVSEKVMSAEDVAAMLERAEPSMMAAWSVAHQDVLALAASHEALRALATEQVAALREALDSFRDATSCPGGKFCSLPEHPCLFHQVQRTLTDTEAAAREHDRRLRLEGAREFVRRWDTRIGTVTHADLLDDMEADQT